MKLTRFLLAVSFAWAVQAPAQDIAGSIKHTPQTITIDGNDDEAIWAEAIAYNDFFHAASNPPDDDADLSATWRALWDDENLYFFIEVTDDAHVVGDSNDWQDDSIELYLDADGLGKDEGPTIQDYAATDDLIFPVYQLTILAGEIELYNGINHANWIIANDDVAEMNAAAPIDGTNYSFEIAIPWSTLGESTPEDIIQRGFFGLGLAVNDDDDEGERDSQIMWATDNGELWHDATVFPNVELLFPELPGPKIFVKKNVDHGQISAEQAVHDFVLPVRNWGQENALTISSVTVTGPDADLVTVGEFSSVAANSVGELPYSLDTAGRTGAFDFTLVIESDDVDPDDQTKMTRVNAAVINFAGPAIHYAMDDGAEATELRDITGYNRHGTLDEASLVGEGLAGGGSLSVSGGSQGVIPGSHLGTMRNFSVSLWAQPAAAADLQTLFSHGSTTPAFAILLQDGDLAWFAGGAPEFDAPGVITAGTAYHVVATFNNAADARQVVLYLDGQPVATQDDPIDVQPSPLDNYFIGAFDGNLPFAGLIDDVQIYDRVLSGEEVEFLFANPGEPWSGNVDVGPDADAVVLTTDAEAGFVADGSAAGSAGLRGGYWNLEPKAVPTTDEPMHRSGDGGVNSGWVDENVYATETTGTFVSTAFEYRGNDLTPITEWLGADAGSFTGTEGDLDDGVFRFQGYLHAPMAGNQEITFISDDGSVLYVGNQLVINNDNGHGDAEVSGKVFFPEAGYYPVDIRYFNGDWTNEAGDEHGGANFIVAGLDNTVQWAGTPPPTGDGGGEGIPGLLGYWRLDGNAEDASGQGVDGNVISPDGVWIDDPERGAVYQSGNGSFIELGTLPVIGLDTDLTWSFWVNSDETDNNNIVFGNRWAPDGMDFEPREFIKFTPTTFEWHFDGIGENVPMDNTMFVVGEWAHNLVVKSGTSLTYYRDGVEVASGTITGAPVNAQPLYLGGQNDAENFSGRLDEVAIFNRALSADEVAEVYGRGLAGQSLSGGDPIDPGGDGALPSLTNVGFTVDGFGVTIPGDQAVDIQFSLDLIDWDIIATDVTGAYEDTDATRTNAEAGYYRASQE